MPPQSLAPHHPAQTAAALAAADAATLADPDVANADEDAGHNNDAAAVDAVDADEEVVAITAGAGAGAGGAQSQPDGSTAGGRRVRRRTAHHHS